MEKVQNENSEKQNIVQNFASKIWSLNLDIWTNRESAFLSTLTYYCMEKDHIGTGQDCHPQHNQMKEKSKYSYKLNLEKNTYWT